MIHFWTLVSGLLGYLAFEVFEARKRWLANRKDNSVFRELAGMWLALIFFGIASAAFAEYIVNGVPTPQNVSWTFAVDPFIRGLAAGFALIPMITRFNSSLDEKRTENIVVSKTKPSFRDMIGEYLRQRR